jgi:hypothetical protein
MILCQLGWRFAAYKLSDFDTLAGLDGNARIIARPFNMMRDSFKK